MGSMSKIPSTRKRNRKQERRRKRGLIIGSVVVFLLFLALLLQATVRMHDYHVAALENGATAEEMDEVYEKSVFDFFLPFQAGTPGGTTHTITGATADADAGRVTPDRVTVTEGGSVTLKAVANTGYVFQEWKKGSDTVSQNSVLTLTDVKADETYTAYFTRNAYKITYKILDFDLSIVPGVSASGGYISGDCTTETVPAGTSITLQANPYAGYKFDNWVITTASTIQYPSDPSLTYTVNSDVQIVAAFERDNDDVLTIVGTPSNLVGIGDQRDVLYTSSFYTMHVTTGTQPVFYASINNGFDHNSEYVLKDILDADTGKSVGYSEQSYVGSQYIKSYKITLGALNWGGKTIILVFKTKDASSTDQDCALTTVASPKEGGVTSGDIFGHGAVSVTANLDATPNKGYMFDHWEYYDNGQIKVNRKQSFTTSVTGYQVYTAYFVKDGYEIKGVCDPEGSGYITGLGKYDTNSDATVTATPASGYVFDKWTYKTADGESHESTNPTLTIKNITEDYNLTAHFIPAYPTVSVTVTPVDASGSLFNYAQMSDGTNQQSTGSAGRCEMAVASGGTVTFEAFPNDTDDYAFAYWVDQDGNTSSNNPFSVGNITDDCSYIAVFTKKQSQYEISAVPDPSGAGTFSFVITNPADAFNDKGMVPAHANAVITPNPATGYVFDKWTWRTKAGIDRESRDAQLTINDIMEDYAIVGHFIQSSVTITVNVDPLGEKDGSYNYVEITDSDGHATSTDTTATGSLNVTGGSVVTLKAVPNKKRNSEFSYWVDEDGNTSSANPFVIGKADKNKTIYAIFTSKEDDDITVLASPPSGGKVSCAKTDTGGYRINATANRGYTFLYWKCADTGAIIRTRIYTMDAAEGAHHYTYIAYFLGDKDAKFTSDLTRESFPNIRRLFSQPNYKYTRASWSAVVANYINSIRGNYPQASGTPKTYAAYSTAEEAAKEKAAEYAPPKITVESELITTDNEIIPITDTGDPDSALERALSITIEKFGDRYTPEVICVKDVSAPNGFVDGIRTYIWSDTGVEKNDNLFIIYQMNGEERIVTPIADHKGRLRFTINKLGAVNCFTLVRVTVE